MIDPLTIAPLAVMGGGLALLSIMKAADAAGKAAEAHVGETENPHSRSTVGKTSSDALDRSQVKSLCAGCGDVVSASEQAKCGDCPGVGR